MPAQEWCPTETLKPQIKVVCRASRTAHEELLCESTLTTRMQFRVGYMTCSVSDDQAQSGHSSDNLHMNCCMARPGEELLVMFGERVSFRAVTSRDHENLTAQPKRTRTIMTVQHETLKVFRVYFHWQHRVANDEPWSRAGRRLSETAPTLLLD